MVSDSTQKSPRTEVSESPNRSAVSARRRIRSTGLDGGRNHQVPCQRPVIPAGCFYAGDLGTVGMGKKTEEQRKTTEKTQMGQDFLGSCWILLLLQELFVEWFLDKRLWNVWFWIA